MNLLDLQDKIRGLKDCEEKTKLVQNLENNKEQLKRLTRAYHDQIIPF